MTAFEALTGTVLNEVGVDVAGHRVVLTLGAAGEPDRISHTLVLEGVTDVSFFDEDPAPWPQAQVIAVTAEHDAEVMRIDVSFGPDTAGLTVTCTRTVVHRAS